MYRASSDSKQMLHHSAALTTDHEVRLTGLSAQTRYYYTIVANSKLLAGDDAEYSFVTSPNGGDQPTAIWLLGDAGKSGRLPQGEDPSQASVRDAFLKIHPARDLDFIVMLGDNAYNIGSDDQYQRGFFEPYRSILGSKVTWPTQGNHDHSSQAYYKVYSLPTRGESGGVPSGTEQHYSFDHGNAHFISLNSESFVTYELLGKYYMKKQNLAEAEKFFALALTKKIASVNDENEIKSLQEKCRTN